MEETRLRGMRECQACCGWEKLETSEPPPGSLEALLLSRQKGQVLPAPPPSPRPGLVVAAKAQVHATGRLQAGSDNRNHGLGFSPFLSDQLLRLSHIEAEFAQPEMAQALFRRVPRN